MNHPTVSIVMCTYNGEKFVKEQLDSIFAQTYPVTEVIVQDDCSTDGTVDIIRQYAASRPQIKLFVNEKNMGFNPNFQQAIARAVCDYVAISDQDDIWYPHKIERQMRAIGDKDLCATAYTVGSTVESAQCRPASERLERLIFSDTPAGHTMLLSKDFLEHRNQWLTGITYDWSLVLNACFAHGIVVLQEPLNWHRRHDMALGNIYHAPAESKWRSRISPYIFGWRHYRRLQKKQNWQAVYDFIQSRTGQGHEPLAHQISALMKRPGLLPLVRLCLLCLRNKSLIYPDKRQAQGLMGSMRALAYPAIFAYNNYYFDWAE